jgi:hypothetical protein
MVGAYVLAFLILLSLPVAANAKTKPTLIFSANGERLAAGAPIAASSSNFALSGCSPLGSACHPATTCAVTNLSGTLDENGQIVDRAAFTTAALSGCRNRAGNEQEVSMSVGSAEFRAPRHEGVRALLELQHLRVTIRTPGQGVVCERLTKHPKEGVIAFGEPATVQIQATIGHAHNGCNDERVLFATFSLFSAGHAVTAVVGP